MQFAHTSGAEQMSGGDEHGVKTARSSQFPAAAGRPQVGRGPDAAAESRPAHTRCRRSWPTKSRSRVRAPTIVVRGDASVRVVRAADVRSLRLRHTLKNVDDVLAGIRGVVQARSRRRSQQLLRETMQNGPPGCKACKPRQFKRMPVSAISGRGPGRRGAHAQHASPAFAPAALRRATSACR